MTFYHITPKVNLRSIMELGIIPDYSRNGITTLKATRDPFGVVFLTNYVDKIICEQLGLEWVKDHDPVVFEIIGLDLNIRPYLYTHKIPVVESDYEFVYNGTITPKHIKQCTYSSIGRALPYEGKG